MLPILATPKYDMIVPSSGKAVTYRPYVVKEEKLLLIAMESKDEVQIEKAVINIIKACVETAIDVDILTTFDLEYIFVTLRSKSVGEGIKITPKCKHCEEVNEVNIDLEKITVANLEDAVDRHVKLTDDISVDLRWQTLKDRDKFDKKAGTTDTIINMVVTSLETIYSGEEIYSIADTQKKEVVDFVESLSSDQFQSLAEVIAKAPYLSYDVNFDCKECSENNIIELKGLIDFFQ